MYSFLMLLLISGCVIASHHTKNHHKQFRDSLTSEDKILIVKLHNQARRDVTPHASNMKHVYWSDELANIAKSFAEKCIGRHNSARHGKQKTFQSVGENIYHTWDWHMKIVDSHWKKITYPLNVSAAFHYWMREKTNFHYIRGGGCSSKCGHYLQIVRDATYAVGCGAAFCKTIRGRRYRDVHNFVCNYGDGYNDGLLPYKTGRKCSECSTGFPVCRHGLCDKL